MREWEQFIPEEERKIYEKAGYKNKDTFGRNPALLIIDVITGFTGTKPMDVMDAIDEFPTSCGKVAWDALPKIQALLHACREADVSGDLLHQRSGFQSRLWQRDEARGRRHRL